MNAGNDCLFGKHFRQGPVKTFSGGKYLHDVIQAKDVCVSCPRQLGLGNRCIERILGGSGQLCVLSSGPYPSGDSTDDHLQVQNHDCTRVATDVLVSGSGEIVHKTPSKTSIVSESLDSTIQ